MLFMAALCLSVSIPLSSKESESRPPVSVNVLRDEVDSIVNAIRNNYVDPLRGTTQEQWDSVLMVINTSLDTGHRYRQDYLWQLRNFTIVINDGHLWFPDGGFFNREGYFSKKDPIFPVWTKAWKDNRVFVVKDYSGVLPEKSELLSINGMPADSLEKRSLDLNYGEREYARFVQNEEQGNPLGWNIFTNLLYMEGIEPPYVVDYREFGSDTVKTCTLPAIERVKRLRMYRKDRNWAEKAVSYRSLDEETGCLRISSFFGGNNLAVAQILLFGMDSIYPRLFRKAMRQLEKDSPENLIIDIRGNQGGAADFMLQALSCLTDEPLSLTEYVYVPLGDRSRVRELIGVRMEGRLDDSQLDSLLAVYDSAEPGGYIVMPGEPYQKEAGGYTYKGNVYVLIDEGVYSAAVLFADMIQRKGLGVVAGTRSGAYRQVSSGNKVRIDLPFTQWLPLEIPYGMYYEPEENQKYDHIEPDIPLEQSLESWLSGKDEVLEKLVERIKLDSFSRNTEAGRGGVGLPAV